MVCLNILTLLLFALLSSKIAATKLLCDAVTRSRHGFVLKGHVFNSFITERVAFCYSACNANLACQSLNYNLGNRSCEFNSEFSRSQPRSFQENVIYVYADNPDRGKCLKTPILKSIAHKSKKSSKQINILASGTNLWLMVKSKS